MNTDTIIRNNLKRFKSKNRSDCNHIVYNKNHYICPNKFYDKNCVTIFENSYSGTLLAGDILLLTFGGSLFLASYISPGVWNGDVTVLSELNTNPGAGIVFKTTATGEKTITWSLSGLTGCV